MTADDLRMTTVSIHVRSHLDSITTLFESELQGILGMLEASLIIRNDFTPPFGIGEDDLIPGGLGGVMGPGPGQFGPGHPSFPPGQPGGNLIGPRHPGFGPHVNDPYGRPGRGPPGARFDPYGPPGVNRPWSAVVSHFIF